MCGRLAFFEPQNLKDRYNLRLIPVDLRPENNFSPGMAGPVVIAGAKAEIMKWGLVPTWAKDAKIGWKTFNARAETILDRPVFRRPFLFQRCLVPANGFYEWDRSPKRQPYYLYNQNQPIMSLAGIFDNQTFSIITTQPNREVKPIHERMPVILNKTDETAWLANQPAEKLLAYLRPYPDGRLTVKPLTPGGIGREFFRKDKAGGTWTKADLIPD